MRAVIASMRWPSGQPAGRPRRRRRAARRALDQRLGELGVQRVQERLPGDVGRGVDEVQGAAEVADRGAHLAEARLGLGELVAGEAHRVLDCSASAFTSALDWVEDRLGDRLGVRGGEGAGDDVDDPGGGVVGDRDHAQPLPVQRLDRRVVAEGEDRVLLPVGAGRSPVGRARRRPPPRSPGCGCSRRGWRGPRRCRRRSGSAPRAARRSPRRSPRADREGDLGMILVGGAGEEVAGRRGEGQRHQQEEAGERAPVPRPGRAGTGPGAMASASAPPRPRRRRRRRACPRRRRPRPRPRRGAAGVGGRGLGIGSGGAGSGRRRGGPARGGRSSRGGGIGPLIGPLGDAPGTRPRAAALRPESRGLSLPRPRAYRWRRTKATPGWRRTRARTPPAADEERDAGHGDPPAGQFAGRGSSGCG